MEQEIYVAVDLGNSQIRMMAARRDDDGRLDILGMEQARPKDETILNGVIKNSSEIAFSISEMARKLANRMNNHHEVEGLYVSVNGRTLRTVRGKVERMFDTPTEITRRELTSLQQELYSKTIEGKEIYGVTNEEFLIDGDIVRNPEGMVCKHIEANYLIAYAKADIRQSIDSCFDRMSEKLKEVREVLAPTAIAEAVTNSEEQQLGCAVINFGAATTTVAVYHDNYIRHLAIIPFGGVHITNDLKYLNLSFDEAEKVKREYGTPVMNEKASTITLNLKGRAGSEDRVIKATDVINVIEARLSEIVTLCMNEIRRSGYIDRLQAGIVVTGGASRMNDFKEFMEQQTGMKIRYGSHEALLNEQSRKQYACTEYSLLIGMLKKANEACTRDTSVQETPPLPDGGKKNKDKDKDKGKGWKLLDFFTGNDNSIED